MKKGTLPNVTPVQEASLQGLSDQGVRICGPKTTGLENPFTISGRFIASEEEVARLGGSPHRDLVLTVLRDPMFGSYHPMRGLMFFKGDVQYLSGNYSGWFNLDIWAYSGFRVEGTYHVRVSLGEALSNVIETKVVTRTNAESWANTT